MTSELPLIACRGARVPLDGLNVLAPLRAKAGVKIVVGDVAWVEWEGERPDVIAALLAAPGVDLFERRDGRWYLHGNQLPVSGIPPVGEAISIDRAIVPAVFQPIEPHNRELKRVPLLLVRCDTPRPTTALCCTIDAIQPWAGSASSSEIGAVHGARSGSIAWLRGQKLPAIVSAERFWGELVWRPIGWRTEPDWPEAALREAAGVGPNEILVIRIERTEAIPDDAFRPLNRAAIRLATI